MDLENRSCRTIPSALLPDGSQGASSVLPSQRALQRGRVGAQPVGKKPPNPFGLYDMSGNVWERCQDWHDAKWYARSPIDDPEGPDNGGTKVVRGGGWHYFDLHGRSAYRNHYKLVSRTSNTGFRIVRGL